jgi:hypothetical protein
VSQTIEKFKGRVLNPALDIQSPKEGEFVIVLDGWASLDLEEHSQDQRRKEEEKQLL